MTQAQKLNLNNVDSLKVAVFVIANLLLLSWLFVKSESVSESVHINYVNQLENLRELDSEIDGEVFANYMNFTGNYDVLANNASQTLVISQLVKQLPEYLPVKEQQKLMPKIVALNDAFKEKAVQIDLYKRNNAIFKNSLNFFKKSSENFLYTSKNKDLLNILSEYIRLTMYFINKPESSIIDDILLLNTQLDEMQLNDNERNIITNIQMHGKVLQKYRQKIEIQTKKIIHLPSEVQQEEFMNSYIKSYAEVFAIAQRYQQVLFIYSLLLSLYLAYVFVRLNKARKIITKSHQELTVRYQEQIKIEKKLLLHDIAFSNVSEAIALTDAKGNIIDINPAFSKITGYTREEAIGHNPRVLKSGRHDAAFYKTMWDSILGKDKWRGEIWNRKKNGEVYPEILSITAIRSDDNEITNFVAVFSDISHLKLQEERLAHLAFYDELTKLPNRALFTDRLNHAMAQVQRSNTFMAVCFLDLDGFKFINDTYGHDVGNHCLIEMTSRLKSILREGDTVARIGGDEFVLLLVDLKEEEEYKFALNRLLKVISQPLKVDKNTVKVTASIGVTLYPHDNQDADTLLRNADQAMYQAKQEGKNRYNLFDPKHNLIAFEQNKKIASLIEAFERNEFVLHFQPKVEFDTGKVVGAEALIRWQHPEIGIIPPNKFLPLIENHRLIVDIGHWVLTQALSQLSAWQEQGLNIQVSVNVAGLQLQDSHFVENLEKLIAKYPSVNPKQLELEVLETTALEDIVNISHIIEECHQIGVTMALDDFGTGYSSLTYLKQLPAKTLKIDMSFIRDMLDNPGSLAIVHGILGLTTAFQKQSVAEGVETIDHGVVLMKLGCQFAQGYAISKPLPAEELLSWINKWQCPELWLQHANLYWDDADYPMIAAEVEHRLWVNSVCQSVRNTVPIELLEIKNHHLCHFGKWYYSYGKQRYQHLETFRGIEQPHISLHEIAEQINRHIQHGDFEDATNSLDLLLAQKENITAKLKALSLQVALKKKSFVQ